MLVKSKKGPVNGDQFAVLASCDALLAGWRRVQKRSPMAGGDGLGVGTWGLGIEVKIGMLSQSLFEGSYRPGPVRRFSIPKKRGGKRVLGVPCVVDRVAQSSALIVLTRAFEAEFEEDSFGYRPGRSVKGAAERIAGLYRQGYRHVVEADILSYFDNVPHLPLLDQLDRMFEEPRLTALFARWLEMAGRGDVGLLQGAPISPLLANLYLDQIDEAVAGHGARIVRFADDFVILTQSRQAAESGLLRVTQLLRDLGLVLNPAKSRVTDFDHGFSFLGKRFLKSFIRDGPDDDEEDEWENMLSQAIPIDPGGDAKPSRQFRNVEMGEIPALLTRPAPSAAPDRVRALSPRQRTLHLYGKGRRLDCRDACFSVEDGEDEIWLGSADRIDRIDIGPNADVSDTALRFALATDTTVAFVDGFGSTLGKLESGPGGRAKLHLAQARHVIDEQLRLELARIFVAGKIRNQRSVCQRWRNNAIRNMRNQSGSATRHERIISGIEARLSRLASLSRHAEVTTDLKSLLGVEGEAAKIELTLFRLSLKGWEMERRQRRPAPDAVNAVLNWLSHMLARDIGIAISRRGLHSGFSHLHSSEDGRSGLAFDLMEEFRAPLVEAQALTLFNTAILQPGHFFLPPEGPPRTWINPAGIRRIISHYERVMGESRLVHTDMEGKTGWRGVIDLQIGRLVKHFEGQEHYATYKIKA